MPTKITDPTRLAEIAARNERLGFGTTKRVDDTVTYTSTQKPKDNTFSFTQKVDTTNSDTTGSDTPEAPLSETYKGYLPTNNADYEAAQKAYRDSLNYTPLSEEEIRAKTRERMQREIDATNKVYAEKLRQEAIAGRGRLGQSRAIQAASGQLGSTFGQAQKNVVGMENQALEEAINNQRLAEEIRILTEGRKDTVAEAEKQYLAKQTSAKNILDYYAGQVTEKANRLKSTVSNMINSGETIDEATFTEIAKALGVSPLEVKALYNATKIERDTKDNETLSPGEALVGPDGKLIYQNPFAEKSQNETSDIQNYNFYAEQERLAGRNPVSFAQFNTKQSNESLTPYQKFTATQSIAKDTQTRTEQAREMARQANLIKNSYQNIVKGGDRSLNTQAIITSFNKILDPTSVVRESEYDRTAAGQSLLNRLQGKYDNIVAGGAGVTLSTLEEAQKIAEEYLKGAQNSIVQQNLRAQEMATAFGLNPDFVTTGGFEVPTVAQPQTSTDEAYNQFLNAAGVAPTKQEYEEFVGQSIDDNTWSQISGSFNTPVGTGSTTQVESIKDGTKVSTIIGTGKATGIEKGSSLNEYGLDLVLEGGYGAPVKSVSGIVEEAGQKGGWGNRVAIRDNSGLLWTFNHLKEIKLKPGQKVTAGQILGSQGNTGSTLTYDAKLGTYRKPTPQEIKQGKGTHLDITVYDRNGKKLTSRQVAQLLNTQAIA